MFKINYTFSLGFLFGLLLVVFIASINFRFLPEWVTSVATAAGVGTSFIISIKK